MSKFVTAVGALRLVDQKRLSLDTDVNAGLTSWKVPTNAFDKDQRVTFRGLLSMTQHLPRRLWRFFRHPRSGQPGAGDWRGLTVWTTVPPLSMSDGSAVKVGGDQKRLAAITIKTMAPRQRSENRRGATLITSPLGCAGDLAGESR